MVKERGKQKKVEQGAGSNKACLAQPHPYLDTKGPQWQRLIKTIDSFRGKNGSIIPVLQEVQKIFNYIPEDTVDYIANELGIPSSAIYGVITFYAQFYTEPRGKHVIRVCRGTACHVKGGKAVLNAIKDYLQIEEGQSTSDMKFTLESVACLGTCALAPVMIIDQNYYGNLNSQKIVNIVKKYHEES
jgi:NADH:ubiquinone oxidoreductase subunit E